MKSNPRVGLFIYARIAVIAATFAALPPALAEAAIAVTMTWNASPDPSAAGYYVYFGSETRNYTTVINVGKTTSVVVYLPDPKDPTAKYFFAVQAYSATGDRSQLSAETVFAASEAPALRNPGNMAGVMGLSITAVQLSATDPRARPLTYSAGGLPPGLSISSNSGRISGAPTAAGSYAVTVAATNTVGVSATQLFTWTIVGPTGTPPPSNSGNPGGENPPGNEPGDSPFTGVDQTPPTIRITSPMIGRTYETMNSKMIVTGVASDNVGIVSILWANSRGGAGTSLGTATWATTPIDLKMGDNVVTITASDAAGNVQTLSFTVRRIVDYDNYVN